LLSSQRGTQQDKNSGFRGPKALKQCHLCYYGQAAIKSGVASRRRHSRLRCYHPWHLQAEQMQKYMESLKTAADKRMYGS
jgi:hypothetical protein